MNRSVLATMLLVIMPSTGMAQARDEAPLCTDRPSRSNNVCTVPAGRLQIESDILVWTRDDVPGARQDTIVYSSPTLKLGIDDATDVQATITPYVETRIRHDAGVTRRGGFGDVILRVKRRLTDADAPLQIGAMPFVKVPTARSGVGNGAWEGGMSVPIQYALPAGFALGFSPEIDLIQDADGTGRHVQAIGTINIGHGLTDTVAAGVEIWTAQDFDPSGTRRQYSADVFATWLASPRLQFDAGANIGLNRQTPDAQVYVGISTRF